MSVMFGDTVYYIYSAFSKPHTFGTIALSRATLLTVGEEDVGSYIGLAF